MALFKGFSTFDRTRAPYTLTDEECVKRDLLNEFYTKKGDRVMRPGFGSIIWDLLMEPEDDTTVEAVKDDIKRICGKDPRVEIVNTEVYLGAHTIRAEIELKYKLLNTADVLYLEYVASGDIE